MKPNKRPENKFTRITGEAHENLPALCELLALEKGVRNITQIEAVSMAVDDMTNRLRRRQMRRLEQQAAAKPVKAQ